MLNQVHVKQVKEQQEKIHDDSDQVRASSYALLAALLANPASEALLSQLREIETDKNDLKDIVNAWCMLKLVAQRHDAEAIVDEYHVLFIGIGRGELVPFASWYLTGFLMEKPLAHLRQRLSELGFEQQEDVYEPEDHVAALCEVISQLILDEDTDFETERAFYEDFIGNWMKRFFNDLQKTESSGFYRAVGQLGEAFLDIEDRYFSMMV